MKEWSVKALCFLFAFVICAGSFFISGRHQSGIQAEELNNKLPEFSDYTKDIEYDGTTHISRLREYDDYMNVIGYANDDGTKSIYVFDSDVKFVDKDGFIIEKNTKIVPDRSVEGFEYAQEANNIQTYFVGQSSQLKYMICHEQYEITIVPSGSELNEGPYEVVINNTGKGLDAENSIIYSGVYGDSTFVKYTAGLSGVKEEIVCNEFINADSFHFILFTGELKAECKGRAVLLTNNNGDTIFVLPGIVMYDSSTEGRKFSLDSQIELKIIEDGKYELTVIPDAEFLTAEDTAYPVYIDPTVTLSNSQDAVVYSATNKAWNNYGYDSINMVGYSSSNGFGYFYSKPNLSSINSVRYDNILSACYCIREISGTTNTDIIEAYMVSESWSEGNITWNGKPSNLNQKLTACKMKYGDANYSNNNWYSFYVTQACMGWKQGLNNYGIVLMPQDSTVYKAFASREYTSGYTPYWKITYIDEDYVSEGLGVEQTKYYIKNKNTKKYLTHSGSCVLTSGFTGEFGQQWTLIPVTSTYWKICPYTYTEQGLGVSGFDGNGNGLTINYYSSSSSQMWKITRNWNGTYRFQSKSSLDNNHIYAITECNSQLAIYSYNLDYIFDQDWTLEPVDLGTAGFFTQNTPIANSVLEYAEDAGFSAYGCNLPYYDAYDLFDWIGSDRLVITESAGGVSCILIGDGNYTYFRGVRPLSPASYSVYVSDYDPNELKHLNCLIYNTSIAGVTDYQTNSNLVGITYKRGTHFTAAWTISIWGSSFTNDFMHNIMDGYSVYDALEGAVQNNPGNNGLWNYHYLGDTDIVFNHIIQ